jgi:hypothetical protein
MKMADLYGETAPAIDESARLELAEAIVASGIVPPEMAELVTTMLMMVDGIILANIVNDARAAKALMDAGQMDEARAMIEQHRESANQHGLGAMFDSIATGIE